MFANTQAGGLNLGFPDVCLTPLVVPVPIPYPNIALGLTHVPTTFHILYGGTPVHNLAAMGTISNGDNTGVNLGVASGLVMGPDRYLLGSFTTLAGGLPTTRLTTLNIQNSTNCPGISLVPTQFSVLVLAP